MAQAPRVQYVLGSSSMSRRAIMERLLPNGFEVMSPDIDEKAIRDQDPAKLVTLLANAKADALVERLRNEGRGEENMLIITADQVVVSDGQIREKPTSAAEAREFISGYAGAAPSTVGSIAVTRLRDGFRRCRLDTATVRFKPGGVPAEAVEKLIEEGLVFACAGGLMIEHKLAAPHIQEIEGSMDSVQGLSLDIVRELLEEVESASA